MPFYQVVVLAIVQGVTEFLPISSTAHLALVPWVFGWRDPGLVFDIALHLGTLVAVVAYFFRTWVRVVLLALGRRALPPGGADPDRDLYANPRLFWFLVAATLPAAAAGWMFQKQAETTLRSPYVIAVMMIGVGILLWWAERRRTFPKDLGRLTFADSLSIGVAQALAVVPGTSRSGITMAAALFRGVDRSAAARFSFLLSTPIIAGATFKAGHDLVRAGLPPDMLLPFAAGIVISGVTGYLVIAWLIRYLQTSTFQFFVWYRIICGIIILALAFFFRDPAMALSAPAGQKKDAVSFSHLTPPRQRSGGNSAFAGGHRDRPEPAILQPSRSLLEHGFASGAAEPAGLSRGLFRRSPLPMLRIRRRCAAAAHAVPGLEVDSF